MKRNLILPAHFLAAVLTVLFAALFLFTNASPARNGLIQTSAPVCTKTICQPRLQDFGGNMLGFAPSIAPTNGDYLDAVGAQGLFRWSAARMPLKVYIQDGFGVPGYRPSFKGFMVKAFDEWARISNGRLSWRQVSSPAQADIVCSFSDTARTAGHGGFEAGVTQTIIQENRFTGESSIQAAKMSILTQWRGRQFTDMDVYKTCLHEVGHAYGLQGHSNNPSDIMYFAVNPRQSATLGQRDANTIARLYTTYGTEPPLAYAPRGGSFNFNPQFQGDGPMNPQQFFGGGQPGYYGGGPQEMYQGRGMSPYRSGYPRYRRGRHMTQQPGGGSFSDLARQLMDRGLGY